MRKKYIAIVISVVIIITIIILSNIFLVHTVEVVFDKPPQLTNEQEIINLAQIEMGSNIFNLNENNISKRVEASFESGGVAVTDVQRCFPNKVKLFIKERTPILIVPYGSKDGEECIPTDIDFQLTQHIKSIDINYDSILVSGIYVNTTFNQPTFHNIRKILYSFIELNFNTDSLIAFIEEININDNKLIIKLRQGECAFEVDIKSEISIKEQVNELYDQYLLLPHHKKSVFYLKLS